MKKKILFCMLFFACVLVGYTQNKSSKQNTASTIVYEPLPPIEPADPGLPPDQLEPFPLDPNDPIRPDFPSAPDNNGSDFSTNPSDLNYIITKIYKTETVSILGSPSPDQVKTSITYFDGLGRPMQQIDNRQSSSSKDIVTHIEYDVYGRKTKEYLPYEAASTNLAFEVGVKTKTLNYYNTAKYDNTLNPYSEKYMEPAPIARVIKQSAPGNSWELWNGHEIKMEYETNNLNEVKMYIANTSWNGGSGLYDISLTDAGYYATSQLSKTITYDENKMGGQSESSGSTVEFKNKEGQVVLKRTYDSGTKHDTYYVYDIYGNLTYVLPPKADGIITTAILDGLCYQYKYDNKNRLAEKKLPGKQWEFIVYDKLDRPVATGPVNSPFNNDASIGWLITKYDVFGRIVYTGWMNQSANSQTRNSLQTAQNSTTVLHETKQTSGTIDGIQAYYSNSIAPTNFKLLTVNYYDNYTFPNAQSQPSSIEGQTVLANIKGIASGNWTRVLSTPSSTAGETNTIFYDEKSRPIKNYLQNYLGGYTSSVSSIDFAGKTLYSITKHKRTSSSAEITVREEFTYSDQDRLLTHTHQINGGTIELLADNKYDALGQLESKKVGNTTASPLQKIDYKYNIRGWLTAINDVDNLQQNSDPLDLFAFKINYNTIQTGISNVKALYNGNIAEVFWRTGSDNIKRAYGYQYDDLNRLRNAVYQKNGLTTNAYNENLAYDKNGNIMSLIRNGDIDPQIGTIQIDDLAYTYPTSSNQLTKVTDYSNNTSGFNDFNTVGDDYTYDDNGNMTVDKNKNITLIAYNHLNLPKKITFGTGNTIEYIYNATGIKLEKDVTQNGNTTTTNYLGGFQYKNNTLEFFPTAEGYFDAVNQRYVYQYKDHLGNVRVSYFRNSYNVPEIIEENNYYPFGLQHKGYNGGVASTNSGQKYKYNGKELQDELNLNVYDYGARNYDPALGRWMNIDPLAEKSRRFSPYAYALDNPVFFIDPDGMEAIEGNTNPSEYKLNSISYNSKNKTYSINETVNTIKTNTSYQKNAFGATIKTTSTVNTTMNFNTIVNSVGEVLKKENNINTTTTITESLVSENGSDIPSDIVMSTNSDTVLSNDIKLIGPMGETFAKYLDEGHVIFKTPIKNDQEVLDDMNKGPEDPHSTSGGYGRLVNFSVRKLIGNDNKFSEVSRKSKTEGLNNTDFHFSASIYFSKALQTILIKK